MSDGTVSPFDERRPPRQRENADGELSERAERIRLLAGQINAAHAELAVLLAGFTSDERWNASGDFRGLSHWLIVNCGMTRRAAIELCAVTDAVRDGCMPTVVEHALRGEISLGMAAMAAKVACPENESTLASIATTATTTQAAKAFRWYRRVQRSEREDEQPGLDSPDPDSTDPSESPDDPARHTSPIDSPASDEQTWWRTWTDAEGFWRVNGRAPVELGALLDEAVEAARRAAQRGMDVRRIGVAPDPADPEGKHNTEGKDHTGCRSAGSRGAGGRDAVANLAAAASAGRSDEDGKLSASNEHRRFPVPSNYEVLHHLARLVLASANDERLTREGGEPFTVNVLIDVDTLVTGTLHPESVCEFLDGNQTTPAVVRMLAETGSLQLLWHQKGVPLKLGTAVRLASPAQRRLLRTQYGGCAVPGCGQKRFLHYHHVVHYPDGPTDLGNLVPLCGAHHRAIHDGTISVRINDRGWAEFRYRDGKVMANELVAQLRSGGTRAEGSAETGGTPDRAASDQAASDHAASDQAASDDGVPGREAFDGEGPGRTIPERSNPSRIAATASAYAPPLQVQPSDMPPPRLPSLLARLAERGVTIDPDAARPNGGGGQAGAYAYSCWVEALLWRPLLDQAAA